ncbi:MAG: hypothetical protein K9K86_10455 [Pseudomonadales bacterium]|nr:hypothetical protein [Pseudomonadales bacterium]
MTVTMNPKALKTILLSALALGGLVSAYHQHWVNTFIVLGILVLSLTPTVFARQFSVSLPVEFDLVTIIFIFAAIFLGELAGFYERFWWWDELLHLTSGLLLGMLGLCLVWVLNFNERIDLELSYPFISLFTFTFALSIGAIWEIFEYGMDNLFTMNMQKSGLDDTMSDLMVDAVGAFIVAVGAYTFLSTGRKSLISYWLKRFIEVNRAAIKKRARERKQQK